MLVLLSLLMIPSLGKGNPAAWTIVLGTAAIFLYRWYEAKSARDKLVARFGPDIAARIRAREVWEGATQEMVEAMLGRPVDIAESVYKSVRRESWKYRRVGRHRYGLKIEFEDGVCVGWERLR